MRPPAGEGLVPEPQDEAQAAKVGGRVTGGAAEEKGQPAREPLEGRYAATGCRGRRRHQRRLDTHTHADPFRGASSQKHPTLKNKFVQLLIRIYFVLLH